MLLLIDNYDSFAHNLARYLTRLDADVHVVRNDRGGIADLLSLRPSAVVLSPGPCTPAEAGCCLDLVRLADPQLPILGVCLGHQVIVSACGGRVVRGEPRHGRTSLIRHNGEGIFRHVPNPFAGCRYHSLVAHRDSLPAQLQVTAETDDGTIMAVQHRQRPVVGVQFHPEAILTEHGYLLLANFLRLAGMPPGRPTPERGDELRCPITESKDLPSTPVTF